MPFLPLLFPMLFFLVSNSSLAQPAPAQSSPNSVLDNGVVTPRMRLIIDNDFGGDPDGLFQLVHHLLSPSVEIRAIIGSHLKPGDGFDPSTITATHARQKIDQVLNLMSLGKPFSVYEGSNQGLVTRTTPAKSAAAEAIIREAMREDTKLPLYIVCGAGLTDLASACLMEPRITRRLTLIWIGGPEYAELAPPPPGYSSLEYNLGIDVKAAQVLFNQTDVHIWQVPRNAYRQVLLPYSSLLLHVKPKGKTGAFLTSSIENVMKLVAKANLNIGETYIIGDSPLVLLTALQTSFEADPASSQYSLRPAPLINDQGLYEVNTAGRNIRVYNQLDVRLLVDDFFAKLILFAK